MLRRWLEHPLTRGRDLDDPATTKLRRKIIAAKPFLRRVYEEWYGRIASAMPVSELPALEVGAGAGFLAQRVDNLIASDVLPCAGIDIALDATRLPFRDASLRGIAFTNVLHHVRHPRKFFSEAARCVQTGGAVLMVEPWVTTWSSAIYRRVHQEPFEPSAPDWELPPGGPLSMSNQAMPWIIFERDRRVFESEFPMWRIARVEPMMPFRYLLSGGMSSRSVMPGWSFGWWTRVESALQPWMSKLAMFAFIELRRIGNGN